MDGVEADEILRIEGDAQGDRLRIVFKQNGVERYFEAYVDHMRAAMPFLAKLTKNRFPRSDAIDVADLFGGLSPAGEFLLTFENPQGAEIPFHLSREQTEQLSSLASQALAPRP